MRRATLIPLFILAVQASAEADSTRLSNLSWSQFSCAAYARATDKDEFVRLFQAGYKNGKDFLLLYHRGNISDTSGANWHFQSRLMSGAHPDFILGMIWEAAVSDAYQYNSAPIMSEDWKSNALVGYNRGNCSLL